MQTTESFTTPPRRQIRFEPTKKISERKRNLFPSNEQDNNSDLGHMSPLETSSSPEKYDSPPQSPAFSRRFRSISDLRLYLDEQTDDVAFKVLISVTPSPQDSPEKQNTELVVPETCVKNSPSQIHKTPHESSKQNTCIPRLIRKSHNENSILKRKSDSPDDNSQNKLIKMDSNNSDGKLSKVRTALFTENISAECFYPKIDNDKLKINRYIILEAARKTKISKKNDGLFLCNRKKKGRSSWGQINAGVRHKIKKSKQKSQKLSKTQLLKAAIDILDKSPLNDYSQVIYNDKQENVNQSQKNRPSSPTQNNIKFKLDNGEMSLIEQKIHKPAPINFEFDNNLMQDNLIGNKLKNIKNLENDEAQQQQRINEMSKSIQSDNMLLSPTSLVCDMTSGLALNSPGKSTPFVDSKMDDKKKVYPVFYKNNYTSKKTLPSKKSIAVKNLKKQFKNNSKDQLLIDAGQKKFGAIQCTECKLLYSIGDPNDEITHYNYHNSIHVLKFNGWKNERVLQEFSNGRIILIQPNDPKSWWRKVNELIEVIDKKLGNVQMDTTCSKVYLYIVNKQIAGCVLAEPKTEAHKIIFSEGIDLCSKKKFSIKCGISRIWVTPSYRRKGIATALLNSVRSNFCYGSILSTSEIAFSLPTDIGKEFFKVYTNTDSFNIYIS